MVDEDKKPKATAPEQKPGEGKGLSTPALVMGGILAAVGGFFAFMFTGPVTALAITALLGVLGFAFGNSEAGKSLGNNVHSFFNPPPPKSLGEQLKDAGAALLKEGVETTKNLHKNNVKNYGKLGGTALTTGEVWTGLSVVVAGTKNFVKGGAWGFAKDGVLYTLKPITVPARFIASPVLNGIKASLSTAANSLSNLGNAAVRTMSPGGSTIKVVPVNPTTIDPSRVTFSEPPPHPTSEPSTRSTATHGPGQNTRITSEPPAGSRALTGDPAAPRTPVAAESAPAPRAVKTPVPVEPVVKSAGGKRAGGNSSVKGSAAIAALLAVPEVYAIIRSEAPAEEKLASFRNLGMGMTMDGAANFLTLGQAGGALSTYVLGSKELQERYFLLEVKQSDLRKQLAAKKISEENFRGLIDEIEAQKGEIGYEYEHLHGKALKQLTMVKAADTAKGIYDIQQAHKRIAEQDQKFKTWATTGDRNQVVNVALAQSLYAADHTAWDHATNTYNGVKMITLLDEDGKAYPVPDWTDKKNVEKIREHLGNSLSGARGMEHFYKVTKPNRFDDYAGHDRITAKIRNEQDRQLIAQRGLDELNAFAVEAAAKQRYLLDQRTEVVQQQRALIDTQKAVFGEALEQKRDAYIQARKDSLKDTGMREAEAQQVAQNEWTLKVKEKERLEAPLQKLAQRDVREAPPGEAEQHGVFETHRTEMQKLLSGIDRQRLENDYVRAFEKTLAYNPNLQADNPHRERDAQSLRDQTRNGLAGMSDEALKQGIQASDTYVQQQQNTAAVSNPYDQLLVGFNRVKEVVLQPGSPLQGDVAAPNAPRAAAKNEGVKKPETGAATAF